jgi:hypothetical protein
LPAWIHGAGADPDVPLPKSVSGAPSTETKTWLWVPSPVFQVTVVVPLPSPVDTGFGDAVIVAADAAGLAGGACASGVFEGLHPMKKNSGKRIAVVEISRFINSFVSPVSRNSTFAQVISLRRQISSGHLPSLQPIRKTEFSQKPTAARVEREAGAMIVHMDGSACELNNLLREQR